MADTVEELERQLAKVRREMLSPAEVTFADRGKRSRSMTELKDLESRILAQIGALGRRPRMHRAVASKGL